jgi:hypothetical protein
MVRSRHLLLFSVVIHRSMLSWIAPQQAPISIR